MTVDTPTADPAQVDFTGTEVPAWLRNQVAKISPEGIEIDGVDLPGVLDRDVTVRYTDKAVAKEWPTAITVTFHVHELEVDPVIADRLTFLKQLAGPPE